MAKSKSNKNNNKKKKNTYKDIDFNDSRAPILANMFLASEGKMTRDAIINRFNRTFYYQLRNKGWIEEKDGAIIPTRSFTNDFKKADGREKVSYGGSGCTPQHSNAISMLVSFIPDSALLRGDYKSGSVQTTENKNYKRTPKYRKDREKIIDNINKDRKEAYEKYQKILKDSTIPNKDKIYAKNEYKKALKIADIREKVIHSKRNISPPDLWVKLTRTEALEYVNSVRENIENVIEEKYRDMWSERLDNMEERANTSVETMIEYNFEVITDSYRMLDIVAKENYSYVNNTTIDFLRV